MKFLLIASPVVSLLLLFPVFSYASEIRFSATTSPAASSGSETAIEVFVDTKGEEITALSGEVVITDADGDEVDITHIYDGESVIGAWLLPATIDNFGKVRFSGIIPGGITTEHGKILTLSVVPRSSGELRAAFSGDIFLDRAPGSPVPVDTPSTPVFTKETVLLSLPLMAKDVESPYSVTGMIAQNSEMFDGKPFIIIHAKDTMSGVFMYELLETSELYDVALLSREDGLPWKEVKGPEPLKYPVNTRYIYIRASDREGNKTVRLLGGPTPTPQLSPEKPAKQFSSWSFLAIIMGAAGVILFLWLWFKRRSPQSIGRVPEEVPPPY